MVTNEIEVDARNMACPMPLLKLKQALNKAERGDIVILIATDPTSKRDFASFIMLTDHLLNFVERGKEIHFRVTKG